MAVTPRSLKYPSLIIVLSDSYKKELCEKYEFLNKNNVAVFPNVIDLKRFEKYKTDNSKKRNNERISLLYFGIVAERRGIFDALDAVYQVVKKGFKLRLIIVGPVDNNDKKKFNHFLKNPEYQFVEHIPWIDISELKTFMHISDIFLAPLKKNLQHESGVANKIYQYMYGQKPIIASNCGPQKKLIESANCGLIYDNQQDFIDKIILLIKDKELRKQMGENGLRLLYKKYGSGKYENLLVKIYDRLQYDK